MVSSDVPNSNCLERFPAKWIPVRVKKTRQTKNLGRKHHAYDLEPRSDSIGTEKALVTFPSGHTILAIIITYTLRGSRWTFIPAFIVNGAMMLSTVPHGGHHLFDLVVGAAIAALAIVLVRLPFGVRRYPLEASAGVGLANG
jgi:membrane-associated phospholipid phosphatase